MAYKSESRAPLIIDIKNGTYISLPFNPNSPKGGVRGQGTQNESKSGYRAGDVVIGYNVANTSPLTHEGTAYNNIYSFCAQKSINITMDRAVVEGRIAILAIPHKYFNTGYSKTPSLESLYKLSAKMYDACLTYAGVAYDYWLFYNKPDSDKIYTSGTNQIDDKLYENTITNRIQNLYNNTDNIFTESVAIQGNDLNRLSPQTAFNGVKLPTLANTLQRRNVTVTNNLNTKSSKYDYSLLSIMQNKDYVPYDLNMCAIFTDFCRDDDLANINVSTNIFNISNTDFVRLTDGNFFISSWISSALPVFSCTLNGLANLKNYLLGMDYVPDNEDDFTPSNINLKTDWTIYVKGARRPEIFVTEKSSGIDTFVNGEANTTGVQKNDFYIQYRCPYWSEDKAELIGWNKTDITIPLLPNKKYDGILQTSYESLIAINYEGNYDIENIQDMVYDMSNPAEMPYAQLQFRIFFNEKLYSSWCEFGIGYIGSPSIEDFAKMNNWGIVTGVDDGSTVTIIYDKYPDGYNPNGYDKPPNDSDDDITNPNPETGNGTLPNTSGTNNGVSLLSTSYAVTDSNLRQLGNFLWTATIFDDIRLINNSPLDNIVSTKIMPIALTGKSSSLQIGNIDTEINAEIIESVPIIDVGSLKWVGYYNNFLDYAPYTQAYIFLPFIGFYEIDPAQCVGHTLNVKYSFDIILGQCKAMLFVDNIYYMSYEGACGVDIPLTGNNRAQLEASFLASTVTSMLTANPLPLVMTAINSQFQSQRSGAYSPSLGWGETRRCFVVFMIPNSQYSRTYGHDYGYPCNLSYNLGQLSGFTQTIPNPDISGIACTDKEGEMIKQLLASGVYL